MKIVYAFLAVLFLSLTSLPAMAFQADHFKGAYAVLKEQVKASGKRDEPAPPKYFICDVDTVANIWAKYGEGDLPESLQKVKNEPSILAGFNFRQGLFFTLEANALIGPEYMTLGGANNDRLEIRHRSDGHYDLAVRIEGVVNIYELNAREPLNR